MYYIVTSKGIVRGIIDNKTWTGIVDSKEVLMEGTFFVPIAADRHIIDALYDTDENYDCPVENQWVKIPLSDGFYGHPEYPLMKEG